MFRRALATAVTTVALLAVGATPAHAIGGPNTLTVITYYDSAAKINMIGQKWSGCNQPSGSWGSTSSYLNLFFPPC